MIWERLIKLEKEIIEVLDKHLVEYKEPVWIDLIKLVGQIVTWSNMSIRRAHVDVVDARDTKGLWMAHICLFPMKKNGEAIYGFDIIAGKNKVTGAFHDFSFIKERTPINKMVYRRKQMV